MLKRFELKVGVLTGFVALLCFLVEAQLNGHPDWLTLVCPIVIGAAAGGFAFLHGRRPLQTFITAKSEMKAIPIITQFETLNRLIDDIVNTRLAPLKTELASAKADLADYSAKEVELNLIHRIDDELQNTHLCEEALERIVKSIRDDMGEHIVAVVSFRQLTRDDITLSYVWGIDVANRKTLASAIVRALASIVSAPSPILWGRADTAHLSHALPAGTERIMIVPLKGSYQFIGCLVLCINTDKESSLSRILRCMKKVGEHASRLLYRIALAEEREENRRRDKLTQALNRTTLSEKLGEMTQAESKLSMLLVEGDNFISLNQAIGRERGDELIKALADTVKQHLRAPRTSSNIESFYRTGAAQFGLLLEDFDETHLYHLAERIRLAVAQRAGWPGDVAQWTVSIGAATPVDAPMPSQLLGATENSIAYLRQQQATNKIMFANQLPAKFKRMRSADAGVTGDLKVFDPGELMQSVAIARNTGILRVTTEAGLEFWAFFSDGQLKKAKLGNLRGDAAVVEFVCTFEQGNFRFVESNSTGEGSAEDPRNLGSSYDTKELNSLLMDAALSKDNFATAKLKIGNIDLYVAATPESQKPGLLNSLRVNGNQPTSYERSIMEEMLKMSVGALKLRQIFQKLDTYPSPWLYVCASTLIEQGCVRLTAIKTFTHV